MTKLVERLKRTQDPAARHLLLRTRGAMQYAVRGHVVRRRVARRYLAANAEPKLHIGAGPVRLDGWLNTDLIAGDAYLDLSRSLPFADDTFAFAFGEHVIEHLPERTAVGLMVELRRVLRPGGVLRLTTPDLRKIIALYEDRNAVISRADYARYLDEQTGRPHERAAQILNDYLRLWGHQWVYDEEDLGARLHEAGFTRVQRLEAGHSERRSLQDLERHGGAEWVNRAEAMALEAIR
ncbi:MAG: methyltransferase domain-containing protein [Solirubrobacterales bacterium]|nr:methyltransferase domain-containing protein [Solirubrobacterales bacterium]